MGQKRAETIRKSKVQDITWCIKRREQPLDMHANWQVIPIEQAPSALSWYSTSLASQTSIVLAIALSIMPFMLD